MAKSPLPLETPDRRLILKFAEKASLDPFVLFEKILSTKAYLPLQTIVENRRFKQLLVDLQDQTNKPRTLNLFSIEGLEVERLTILGGAFSDIVLPQTRTLVDFFCIKSQLRNLGTLGAPNLRCLDVTDNNVGFIDLPCIQELVWYKCAWNQFRYINELPRKLETLICPVNKIRFLDLSGAPGLKHLDCYTNNIENLDLSRVPHLQSLNCGFNRISSLNLRSSKNLIKLKISEMAGPFNFPETPDFSILPDLQYLDCCHNRFRDLNLSGLPSLRHLSASGNEVEFVDFSLTPNLNELYCDWDLNAKDLSRLPKLKKLSILEGDLEVNGLCHTPNLEELSLNHCPVKSLDISRLPNLRVLMLRDCDILEKINLSSAPHLEVVEIWGSACDEIDIRELPSLKELTVDDGGIRVLHRADQEHFISRDS